jgi:hypothetical protein
MRRRARRGWLIAALANCLALGCQLGGNRPAYSDDPLVLTKKPLEGKPTQTDAPLLLAHAEPAVPLLSATALAQAPPQATPSAETAERSPAVPAVTPRPGLPVGTAVRIKPLVRPEAVPMARERPAPAELSPPAAPGRDPF